MSTQRSSSSVAKAFEIISVVAEAGSGGIGLQPLAASVGVAVSTAHRYVTSLLEVGVIDRTTVGTYRLGVTLVMFAGQYLDEDVLRRVAHSYLVEIAEISGETAHLGVRVGDRVVYLDKVESAKSVRLVSRIGSSVPMHCTSMGKSILSHESDSERQRVLRGDFSRPTPRSRIGPELLAELDLIRSQGFAIDDEENEIGVRCIGIPILNAAGEPFAAFSVSAPANRFSVEECHELAPVALRMGAEISRQLGYAGSARLGVR